jgi:hypothetical protein
VVVVACLASTADVIGIPFAIRNGLPVASTLLPIYKDHASEVKSSLGDYDSPPPGSTVLADARGVYHSRLALPPDLRPLMSQRAVDFAHCGHFRTPWCTPLPLTEILCRSEDSETRRCCLPSLRRDQDCSDQESSSAFATPLSLRAASNGHSFLTTAITGPQPVIVHAKRPASRLRCIAWLCGRFGIN